MMEPPNGLIPMGVWCVFYTTPKMNEDPVA